MKIRNLFREAIFIFCAGTLLLQGCNDAASGPGNEQNQDKSVVITNVTDPAMPGKLSVIVGDGWDVNSPVLKFMTCNNTSVQDPSKIENVLFPHSKSKTLRVVKIESQILTCDFPDDKFSVYAIVAKGKDGWSKPVIVNAAKVQWMSKETAAGGDTVRLFGRNLVNLDLYPKAKDFEQSLGYGSYIINAATTISLETPDGAFQRCKVIKSSAYDVQFVLPASLADGEYKIAAHNGLGGKYGWSEPVDLKIKKPVEWPTKVFNVKDFGAIGEITDKKEDGGWNNDAIAIQKALDAAGVNGGGIVYFPAGSYYVAKTLSIPRYTVLRGESRERSWIWFPDARDHGKVLDFENAPKVQVGFRGLSDFTFENLNIHSVYTNILIAAPMTKDNANEYSEIDLSQRADNVTIRNCNIIHEPYYHYNRRNGDPFLGNNSQFDESWGMKATIAIHGNNTSISNSRIRGGGMAIVLISSKYSLIANNELIIGRAANAIATREFGYPGLPCPQKIIIEDNVMWPATPVHHSGLWCHAVTKDIYIARNQIQLTWGSDAEGLLWHGWGPEKSYETSSATENTITAKDVDKIDALGWECIVVKGKGIGQKRVIKEIKGNTLVLDKPWDLIPGEDSKMELMYYHVHEGITIVQNKLADMGAGIFAWGESWNWIVDGNSLTRCGGGMLDKVAYTPARAWSGNYFDLVLNNKIDQGRYDNPITGFVWTRGYCGTGGYREFGGGTIANLGHIYRGNLFTNDCALAFWDKVGDNWDKTPDNPKYFNFKGPLVDIGTVAEDNWFKNCKLGISVGDYVSGVERGNKFNNVNTKVRLSSKADMINDDKSK